MFHGKEKRPEWTPLKDGLCRMPAETAKPVVAVEVRVGSRPVCKTVGFSYGDVGKGLGRDLLPNPAVLETKATPLHGLQDHPDQSARLSVHQGVTTA